jgi:hypothetical protein
MKSGLVMGMCSMTGTLDLWLSVGAVHCCIDVVQRSCLLRSVYDLMTSLLARGCCIEGPAQGCDVHYAVLSFAVVSCAVQVHQLDEA